MAVVRAVARAVGREVARTMAMAVAVEVARAVALARRRIWRRDRRLGRPRWGGGGRGRTDASREPPRAALSLLPAPTSVPLRAVGGIAPP